jgi:hypothetical protein
MAGEFRQAVAGDEFSQFGIDLVNVKRSDRSAQSLL